MWFELPTWANVVLFIVRILGAIVMMFGPIIMLAAGRKSTVIPAVFAMIAAVWVWGGTNILLSAASPRWRIDALGLLETFVLTFLIALLWAYVSWVIVYYGVRMVHHFSGRD